VPLNSLFTSLCPRYKDQRPFKMLKLYIARRSRRYVSLQESRAIAKMTVRPIYGCPENFRESLAMPTATFPEIANGLLLRSIILKCVQNLKFVALTVP